MEHLRLKILVGILALAAVLQTLYMVDLRAELEYKRELFSMMARNIRTQDALISAQEQVSHTYLRVGVSYQRVLARLLKDLRLDKRPKGVASLLLTDFDIGDRAKAVDTLLGIGGGG